MSCTSPTRELLTFWLAGSLDPLEAAQAQDHVAGCADCRIESDQARELLRGLRDLHLLTDEVVAAAAYEPETEMVGAHLRGCARCRQEVALLRAVNADLARTSSRRRGRWLMGLAAAAVLLIAVPIVRQVPRPLSVEPAAPVAIPAASTEAPAPTIPRRVIVEKASLASLANETIVLRGASGPRQALLADLAAALEPYQRDDFSESTVRLRALRARRPDAPEVAYYLGVCFLLLGQPADAIEPLEQAGRISSSVDTAYYLAVARVNAGQTQQGRAQLTSLCDAGGSAAPRACAALAQASGSAR